MASIFTNPFCTKRSYLLFCAALKLCADENEVSAKNILYGEVRQSHCTAEWRILEVNNKSEGLIDCHGFEETSQPNCSKQFDLANNGSICLPLCKEFSQLKEQFTDVFVGLYAFFHLVNVLGGIIVFGACLWNRSKM